MNRTFARLFVAGALVAFGATPAFAQSIVGDWPTKGRHSQKGEFTGTVKLTESRWSGYVTLSAEAKTTAGDKLSWSGSGFRRGRTLSLRLTVKSSGLAGAIGGDTKKDYGAGTYTLSLDGRTIKGSWKSDRDASLTVTETLSKDATPPSSTSDLAALVKADGKEADEECLALHVADAAGAANDTLTLKLKKNATAPADAQLQVEFGARVALYKGARAAGSRLTSGALLPNADATLAVEGLASSDAGAGEAITVKLVQGARVISQDKVTAHVARSAFHLAGHGAGGAYQVETWLSGARRDKRTQPSFVEGKEEGSGKKLFWAVWVCQTEKAARAGLAVENAVISYDGHSNFGMGFAFETGFTKISQFLNIADPHVPVNWEYLRDHQEHPGLMIEDSEYGDDASTAEAADPIRVGANVVGKLASYPTARYPLSGRGEHLHLTRGPRGKKWLDHHYGEADNWRIVIKAGSSDMPVKKWSKIYLHSCYGGQYYADSFGGKGTLFFTNDEAHAWSTALPAFLRTCIEGKTNDEILKAINKEENLNDYQTFGN